MRLTILIIVILIIVISLIIIYVIHKKVNKYNMVAVREFLTDKQETIGCPLSYKEFNNICVEQCPENYYSEIGSFICNACPDNTISPAGSTTINQCICPQGYFIDGTKKCLPCGHTGYNYIVNATGCFNCPSNSQAIDDDSNDISDCSCNNGYTRMGYRCIPNIYTGICSGNNYYNIEDGKCYTCPTLSYVDSTNELGCICNTGLNMNSTGACV